jgi:glycosyltransferase involved in cell wall biosynthesis
MTISITVIMSVYNAENFIKDSISSVLNQTYKNFEFIIINDGSTDSSPKIINQLALTDNRIKVINKSNTGSYSSLNLAIEQARGEWISIIDSDDVYELDKLEKQYSFSKLNKSINLIGSRFFTINEKGKKLKNYEVPTDPIILKDNISKRKLSFPHSSFFYKKELAILNKYRGDFFKIGADYDFCLRFSEIGDVACIESFSVQLRRHTQQISHTEKGLRQLINTRIAQISHLLRKKGYPDPVGLDINDKLYIQFYNFIKNDKELKILNNFQMLIMQIKYLLLNLDFKSFIKLFYLIIKSPLIIFNYIIFYFSGKIIENELINKWIKKDY